MRDGEKVGSTAYGSKLIIPYLVIPLRHDLLKDLYVYKQNLQDSCNDPSTMGHMPEFRKINP